jgi:hypothetical protein
MVSSMTVAPYAFPAPGSAVATVRKRPRLRAAIALGASRAMGGATAKVGLALMALTVLWAFGTALVLTGRESGTALAEVGAASSTLLAWGAGVLIAVPASMQAFREDRASGMRALLRVRGASTTAYAQGRVLGLAVVLFAVVGGGALLSGGAAFLLASRLGVAAHAIQGLVAALVYAAAYALVVAPMSLAALGARSRPGGFLRFLAIVVGPMFVESWTSALVPAGWGDVLSVPSALGALRASLLPAGFDGARLTRAALVLAAFAAISFVLVLAEIAALDAEQRAEGDEVRG